MSTLPGLERGRELLGGQPLGKRDAGLLMVLPGLALFAAFMLYPIAHLVWISLTDATHAGTVLGGGASFVGLQNYVDLFGDPQFWNSLGITWLFLATSLAIKIVISVGISLVLTHARVVGKRYMRAAIVVPLGFPPIFTITTLRGIFSGARFGALNQMLGAYNSVLTWLAGGVDTVVFWTAVTAPDVLLAPVPMGWLQERWLAFSAYVAAEVWLAVPFMTIIIVSALQDVPGELHDAAKVDGAGFLTRFVHVTLPAIKRPVIFASVLTAAASFQQFLVPWVFNEGGPGRSNELILVYGYREAIQLQQYGDSSAVMVTAIMFIGMFMWIAVRKTNLAEGVGEE